jgi:hypothetical protein
MFELVQQVGSKLTYICILHRQCIMLCFLQALLFILGPSDIAKKMQLNFGVRST